MFCDRCGSQMSEGQTFCTNCGCQLPPPIQQPQQTPVQQPQPQPQMQGGMWCSRCNQYVVPLVTSVGGGSCSVGSRTKFLCPQCGHVLKRKGCFIATATYESADADEVFLLRQYRDNVLEKSLMGRAFIRFYYLTSPYVAKVVESSEPIKRVARRLLDKLVPIAEKKVRERG